jgi:hypothetical protein
VSSRTYFPTPEDELSEQAPAAADSTYCVDPGGRASAELAGSLPTDPDQDQSLSEAVDPVRHGGNRRRRLTFILAAFDSDTTVVGPVTFACSVSITSEDT